MVAPDKILRTNRRTLSLVISKDGSLIVHAPKRVSMDYILSFIKEKEKWITKKQNEVTKTKQENRDLIELNALLFLGETYQVKQIIKNKEPEFAKGVIYIPIMEDDSERKMYLKKWISKQTALITQKRIEYFSDLMQIDYTSLKIMKSVNRWGTCSSDGKISFNYKLSMLPPKLVDYIVIHELAHLIEFNHSKKFYKIIESIMPSWAVHRKRLKDYSYLLTI